MVTGSQTEHGVVRVPLGTWNVDPTHSSVEFSIKHMMIATVRGRFKDFEGTIEAAEDINDSKVVGVVRTASVDTNEPTRDEHLRGADFFDAERYPEARFESRRIVPLGGPNFRVIGDLTLKDVNARSSWTRPSRGPSAIPGATTASASGCAGRSIAPRSGSPGNARSSPGASWSARK